MILCTISQFTCVLPHLGSSLIADYHITSEEFDFIQLVHSYENRRNDDDLVQMIDQYERLYPHINTPRLVALKLLTYHYTIEPLPFDPTVLASYQAQLASQLKQQHQDSGTQVPASALADDILPDPMIQVASGHFVH